MRRVQGDDDAFAELYDRHASRAFRIAHSVCRDQGVAEDVVQEGFLSIWRNRARYRPGVGSFKAWSMQVVRNCAIDHLRRAASVKRPSFSELQDGNLAILPSRSSEDEVIDRSEAEAMGAALSRLPEAQAEVISLAFFGELTHSEIAQQLSLPKGTVKGRMRLGLQKLRSQLADPSVVQLHENNARRRGYPPRRVPSFSSPRQARLAEQEITNARRAIALRSTSREKGGLH